MENNNYSNNDFYQLNNGRRENDFPWQSPEDRVRMQLQTAWQFQQEMQQQGFQLLQSLRYQSMQDKEDQVWFGNYGREELGGRRGGRENSLLIFLGGLEGVGNYQSRIRDCIIELYGANQRQVTQEILTRQLEQQRRKIQSDMYSMIRRGNYFPNESREMANFRRGNNNNSKTGDTKYWGLGKRTFGFTRSQNKAGQSRTTRIRKMLNFPRRKRSPPKTSTAPVKTDKDKMPHSSKKSDQPRRSMSTDKPGPSVSGTRSAPRAESQPTASESEPTTSAPRAESQPTASESEPTTSAPSAESRPAASESEPTPSVSKTEEQTSMPRSGFPASGPTAKPEPRAATPKTGETDKDGKTENKSKAQQGLEKLPNYNPKDDRVFGLRLIKLFDLKSPVTLVREMIPQSLVEVNANRDSVPPKYKAKIIHCNEVIGEGEDAAKEPALQNAAEDAMKTIFRWFFSKTNMQDEFRFTKNVFDMGNAVNVFPWNEFASVALYKLFMEWHKQGTNLQIGASKSRAKGTEVDPQKIIASLSQEPNKMNPVLLLEKIKPGIECFEIEEPTNLNMYFVKVGYDIEGHIFIGKGHSKKAAAKDAAMVALSTLYGVKYRE